MKVSDKMQDNTRLIEDWFPVNEISIEGIRERAGAIPNPAPHQLHVWWARRPLSISRAAVGASLLAADADRSAFLESMGTHAQVVQEQARINNARANNIRLKQAYTKPRAFTHNPTQDQINWLKDNMPVSDPMVLDVTAGGGSIPFEASRLGLRTIANELNPVAALILRATCEWPAKYGAELLDHYGNQESIATVWTGAAGRFLRRVTELTEGIYPPEPQPTWMTEWNTAHNQHIRSNNEKIKIVRAQRLHWSNLWARTVACPNCAREIPLSPNWRLTKPGASIDPKPKAAARHDGSEQPVSVANCPTDRTDQPNLGVKLLPNEELGKCEFEIVNQTSEISRGTVGRGVAICPYPSCGNTTSKGYLAKEAQAGRMGHMLYCTVYRDSWQEYTKGGTPKKRLSTQRGFRAPRPEDDNTSYVLERLDALKEHWDTEDVLPNEDVPLGNDQRPIIYNMTPWRKMFSPRQQLAHGLCVQAFRELVDEDRNTNQLDNARKATWCYIALTLDKLILYNNILCTWHANRAVVGNIFATHDFGFKWSYAEMTVANWGWGLEWALSDMRQCIAEVTKMTSASQQQQAAPIASAQTQFTPNNPTSQNPSTATTNTIPTQIDNGMAQTLNVDDASIDAIVFDPPYHNNVTYAELSDFFYIWLKRTAGYALGAEFPRAYLTNKTNEAIASPARFKAQATSNAKASAAGLATQDYQDKMAQIFNECRRVIKPNGIMTLMFTHKDITAWDSLMISLINAGFAIVRTWPVKTEAESSMHIRDKSAARSTILIVCRPRNPHAQPNLRSWEEVEESIKNSVQADIPKLESYGLTPVDIYLSAFGPALKVISENWGVQRDLANPERSDDPFAVTPADAMDVARREVTLHREHAISELWTEVENDPLTKFYILAQDANNATRIDFDEANLFAKAVGLDLSDTLARSAVKIEKGKATFLSAKERMAAGSITRQRAPQNMLDAAHTAIAITAQENAGAGRAYLETHGVAHQEAAFHGTIDALEKIVKPGHDDAAPLGYLSELLYGPKQPKQAKWVDFPQLPIPTP